MKGFLYAVLPTWAIYRLLDWRETLQGTGKVYYSQFGEDILLAELTKGQENGFYVDIGANHPVKSSNTYLLHKRGWHGVNIEPDPFLFSLLQRHRKRDINIQKGIGLKESEMTYYRFADSRISTFSPKRAEELSKKGWKLLVQKTISISPLSSVLKELGVVRIDVMNIDTEDLDMQVLQSLDWGAVLPRIIVVESRDFDGTIPERDEIYSFLSGKGYALYSRAGYSLIFTKK